MTLSNQSESIGIDSHKVLQGASLPCMTCPLPPSLPSPRPLLLAQPPSSCWAPPTAGRAACSRRFGRLQLQQCWQPSAAVQLRILCSCKPLSAACTPHHLTHHSPSLSCAMAVGTAAGAAAEEATGAPTGAPTRAPAGAAGAAAGAAGAAAGAAGAAAGAAGCCVCVL